MSIFIGDLAIAVLYLLLNFLTFEENYDSKEQHNGDNEEPDELGAHTLFFFVTELALKSFATDTLSIAALTSILTDASAPFALCLEDCK